MKVNGKIVDLEGRLTILDLLNNYNLDSNKVVVEVNKDIIVKEDFAKINLQEDDTIEVISFVGGG